SLGDPWASRSPTKDSACPNRSAAVSVRGETDTTALKRGTAAGWGGGGGVTHRRANGAMTAGAACSAAASGSYICEHRANCRPCIVARLHAPAGIHLSLVRRAVHP